MITGYKFGSITIDGQSYGTDVIVYSDRVDDTWWRREGHSLCLEDLRGVCDAHPDTLVVGTGYYGRMQIAPELPEALRQRGISLVVDKTAEACTKYNRLKETGNVVAALHLTC